MKPQFPAKVCATRCETCIFGPDSPITPRRFARLASTWAKMKGGHQVCHQYGTSEEGTDVWCKGFWETQISEIYKRIFVAMGYVTFVSSDPTTEP